MSTSQERRVTNKAHLYEFQVIGRPRPTAANKAPKIYRMKIFAPTPIHAKSRFWYFLSRSKKVKTAAGEILSVIQVNEKKPTQVKNFGILCRYNSRTGTHNVYKEFRDVTRIGAVNQLYQDMAARHRARFRSVQIIEVRRIGNTRVTRPNIKQFISASVKFPLPHRILRNDKPQYKTRFMARLPVTHFK
eukprot:TRINITY_DN9229_c1_g1_i1.p1 TRINITY_DN9229_c1_g1~~TRINITY_DN9229_c1_g1_i1.p1  ORF type:complete len:189 (+),score=88.72 TRINITY_DN9229_c1_g1_i1:61-627(+)